MEEFQDALGDYYDAGMIGDPPTLADFTTRCRHCGEAIYEYEWKWRHTNGMYTCTLQQPRPRPKAEP